MSPPNWQKQQNTSTVCRKKEIIKMRSENKEIFKKSCNRENEQNKVSSLKKILK